MRWGNICAFTESRAVIEQAGVGWPSSDRCASVPPVGLECRCWSSATLYHVRSRDQFGGDPAGLVRCQAWPELRVVTDLPGHGDAGLAVYLSDRGDGAERRFDAVVVE
jgi:hypothetical protein